MNKSRSKNLYICKVPFKLKHLYTAPSDKTIDASLGSWRVVSQNMTSELITLARSSDTNTRMRISFEMLDKHFDIVKE